MSLATAVAAFVCCCVGLLAVTLTAMATPKPTTLKALTFLTRDGCVNTPDMVLNLDDALKSLGLPTDYAYINISILPSTDVRTGYPTPTVLYKGKDILGLPEPTPPFAAPS